MITTLSGNPWSGWLLLGDPVHSGESPRSTLVIRLPGTVTALWLSVPSWLAGGRGGGGAPEKDHGNCPGGRRQQAAA